MRVHVIVGGHMHAAERVDRVLEKKVDTGGTPGGVVAVGSGVTRAFAPASVCVLVLSRLAGSAVGTC